MPDALSPAGDADSAKIIAVVSSIPLAVGIGRYDIAEAAFAPEIVIDATSLRGGEPQPVTPAALMDAWRGLVPGFDATRHELSGIEARVDGDTAEATARVDGRRRIGEALRWPIGVYRWRLGRIAGRWKVKAMTFDLTQEIGDRGLVAVAADRARGG